MIRLDYCRARIPIGSSILVWTTPESPAGFLRAVPVAREACSSMFETPPTENSVCLRSFLLTEAGIRITRDRRTPLPRRQPTIGSVPRTDFALLADT